MTDDTLDYISVYHVPVLLVIYIYDVTGYAAVPNVMIKISNNNQICCKNKRILYFKWWCLLREQMKKKITDWTEPPSSTFIVYHNIWEEDF